MTAKTINDKPAPKRPRAASATSNGRRTRSRAQPPSSPTPAPRTTTGATTKKVAGASKKAAVTASRKKTAVDVARSKAAAATAAKKKVASKAKRVVKPTSKQAQRGTHIVVDSDLDEDDDEAHAVINDGDPVGDEDEDDDDYSDKSDEDVCKSDDEEAELEDDDLSDLSDSDLKKRLFSEAVSVPDGGDKPHRHPGGKAVVADDDDEEEEEEEDADAPARLTKHAQDRLKEIPALVTPRTHKRFNTGPRGASIQSPVFESDEDPESSEDEGSFSDDGAVNTGSYLNNHLHPEETHLVGPAPGSRKLPIKPQPAGVKRVITGGIKRLIHSGLTKNPFPSGDYNLRLQRQMLRKTADELGEKAIADRLRKDTDYGLAMARLMNQRLMNLRSNIKIIAGTKVQAYYSLISFDEKEVAKDVANLLQGFSYVYPKNRNGTIINTKPFTHPCILAVMRDAVFRGGRSSLAGKIEDLFPEVDIGDSKRLVVPDAMLCFVATTVHAALDDWKTGRYISSSFNADTYHDVYKKLNAVLDTIRVHSAGAAYKFLMATIYSECSKGTASGSVATAEDAVLLLDVANMPTSDIV